MLIIVRNEPGALTGTLRDTSYDFAATFWAVPSILAYTVAAPEGEGILISAGSGARHGGGPVNRDEVLGEWRGVARTLAAADLLVGKGYAEDAAARAYCATAHGAKAALSAHNVIAESHSSVRGLLGKHPIRTGAIKRTWSMQLAASIDDTLAADYDAATFFSPRKLAANAGSARAFVGPSRRYLLTCGFTDEELTTEAKSE